MLFAGFGAGYGWIMGSLHLSLNYRELTRTFESSYRLCRRQLQSEVHFFQRDVQILVVTSDGKSLRIESDSLLTLWQSS